MSWLIHLLLITSLLLSGITVKTVNGKKKPLIIGFFFLFSIAALRNEYGNDFESYKKIFENAHIGINSANIEVGFFELNKLFPSYHLLLAVLSLVYLMVAYKLIVNNVNKKYQWLSVFILLINPYLFLMSLTSLRQILALCIFAAALNINSKNKNLRLIGYLLLIFMATQIHQTAWLLLPMYIYFNLKRTDIIEYAEKLFFIITPIILLTFNEVLDKLIAIVLGYFNQNLNYLVYINESAQNSLRSTLLTTVYYVYVLLNLKKAKKNIYQYSRMYLCGLLFAILSFRYSMFGRFQMYFDLFGIVVLPMLICECRRQSRGGLDRLINAYIFPALIIVIFLLRYYSFFNTPLWEYFFTYKTFLG